MCVCQEVLGEDVADTWEGSGILFKTKATVATATREMALQQLQTAIELARRSGVDADEVQNALDASFPNGSILRWLKLAAKGTDEKLSISDSAKLTVRERAALKKLVREALDDDGARADMVHLMAVDDLLMVQVLQEQGGDGMVKALAFNLVHEARGVLDLLSGIIAIRVGETPYEDEILSVVKCVREMFGNTMLLAPRARGLQALRDNCPAAPQYKLTRGPNGSIGLHTTVHELLDYLSNFPSWRQSITAPLNRLGIVISTDGAKMGANGGVVSTVVWLVNLVGLQQSSRQVFTLALSNGDDSVAELQAHHHPVFKEAEEPFVWQDPRDASESGTFRVRTWRVADGKGIRLELSRDTAAGCFPCPRCSILKQQLWDFWATCVMDLGLEEYSNVRGSSTNKKHA